MSFKYLDDNKFNGNRIKKNMPGKDFGKILRLLANFLFHQIESIWTVVVSF